MSTLLLLIGGTPEGGTANPFVSMVPFFLILLIFYFILIRPQQKRVQQHQKFVDALRKGDHVITESGMFGTVASVNENSVVIKAGENVKLRFLKAKVSGHQPVAASESKKK